MKKINSVVLSTLTAAILVGCGGGSSSSTDTSSSSTVGTTNVTAERGAIWGATVTDSSNPTQKAKITSATSNVYTFANTPVYPISVTGGIIDMDGDATTKGDVVDFTNKTLISYSNVISPITNYLGDPKAEGYANKLTLLKDLTGATDDELLNKVPSETSNKVVALTNSIFEILNDGNDSNDDFVSDYENSALKTRFNDFVSSINDTLSVKENAALLEDNVLSRLNWPKMGESEVDDRITEIKDSISTTTTTDSTKLKIADLTRFVSYEEGEDWYDDNTVEGGKIMFKSYSDSSEGFVLESNENDYVTIKADASNAHKFSWTDPMTKEEGTFTIEKTEKVTSFEGNTYTDLYKTEATIEITKQAASPSWDRWDWTNPTYAMGTSINDIDSLIAAFTRENSDTTLYTHSDEYDDIMLKSNGDVVKADTSDVHPTRSTTKVGTWVKSGEQINITLNNKERRYIRVVLDGSNYYIETGEAHAVGHIDEEIIFTGSDLDKLIANINMGSEAEAIEVNEPTTPTQATSFVSGKIIVANDAEGDYTAKFYSNGNYEESGLEEGSPYTCTGKWKDLGGNKIASTCDTSAEPDGVLDDNEITMQFSIVQNVGDTFTIAAKEEGTTNYYPMTIKSIINIQ